MFSIFWTRFSRFAPHQHSQQAHAYWFRLSQPCYCWPLSILFEISGCYLYGIVWVSKRVSECVYCNILLFVCVLYIYIYMWMSSVFSQLLCVVFVQFRFRYKEPIFIRISHACTWCVNIACCLTLHANSFKFHSNITSLAHFLECFVLTWAWCQTKTMRLHQPK